MTDWRPAVTLGALLLAACSRGPGGWTLQDLGSGSPAQVTGNDDYLIVTTAPGDSTRSLARRYLGDEGQYWRIEDANDLTAVRPGQWLIIPHKVANRTGIFKEGYRTVPILVYHRFGSGRGRMTISASLFERQLRYLQEQHYRVIPLSDFLGFLRGEKPLPRRAVVLTIDDGHRSIYELAFPLLKKFGFPATVFAYTDYLGNGGLSWRQIDEMVASGLISIQPHSKTHANLALRAQGEGPQAYRTRIEPEVRIPTQLLRSRLQAPIISYAYPYGDANEYVVALLQEYGYQAGLTVQPGGNAAFSYPYLLHRSMIFGDRDMDDFKSRLQTFVNYEHH